MSFPKPPPPSPKKCGECIYHVSHNVLCFVDPVPKRRIRTDPACQQGKITAAAFNAVRQAAQARWVIIDNTKKQNRKKRWAWLRRWGWSLPGFIAFVLLVWVIIQCVFRN